MIRLALRVSAAHAELVLAELLELAPSGVEEMSLGDDVVEYAVYGAPGELPALPDLRAVAGGALVEITTAEVPDDWDRRWREFHRPLVLDGRLTVRPPWEPPAETPIDLVIDPGRAFGTGAHASLRVSRRFCHNSAKCTIDSGHVRNETPLLDRLCAQLVSCLAPGCKEEEASYAAPFVCVPIYLDAFACHTYRRTISIDL